VLGSDVAVIQPLGFFLGKGQNAPRALRESIEFISHHTLLLWSALLTIIT
jgi:hypothetical protein